MSFRDNAKAMRGMLRRAGFAPTGDPYDTSQLDKGRAVMDIEVIARKDYYDVIYLETESNWRGISSDVARKNLHPCLVITRYGDGHTIFSTTRDHYAKDKKARYVVVDNLAKKYSVAKFVRSIKAGPGDDTGGVDAKVQSTLDEFAAYKEALDNFADDLDDIIRATKTAVDKGIVGNKKYARKMTSLLDMCREVISRDTNEDDIRDMLVQHILTYRIFEMVYDERNFHTTNTLAKSLESLRETLDIPDHYANYETVEMIAESLTDTRERQEFLKRVYETFYSKYDSKTADRDGIVYTPSEVVDFMVESSETLLKEHFGKSFSDDGVIMLDPFTGTGTFIVHALERINTDRIQTKYKKDLHANEKYVLPYYIASLNIEHAYHERAGDAAEFGGMCWMDTFESGAKNYEDMLAFLDNDNVRRITRQQNLKINVIIGNPPYSVGQSDANEDNPNLKYDALDKRIDDTYIKVTRQLCDIGHVGSVYDSYIRAFRWASDRLGEFGIIAFVTNAGFLRSDTAAGFRACLHEEFAEVWCFDLRGNQRTKGEMSKREGGKIFGAGSRAPIAITILIKDPRRKKPIIHYKDIGDYLSREEKLAKIKDAKSIRGIDDWQEITPDEKHYWLDQPGKARQLFEKYIPIGSKAGKKGKDENVIFKMYSRGVGTSRDVWVYNTSANSLESNVSRHIDYCNDQDLNNFKIEPVRGKFDSEIADKIRRHGATMRFDKNKIRRATYRPFAKRYLYFDKILNLRQYRIPAMFPHKDTKNLVISVLYRYNSNFSAFVSDITPDVQLVQNGQCFPLYTYDDNGERKDNITDHALQMFRYYYGSDGITEKDIFYYVYAMLHHDGYRMEFADMLIRELPHIPLASNFDKFVRIGKNLAELHLGYENGPVYELGETLNKIPDAPKKITFDDIPDLGDNHGVQSKTLALHIDNVKIYESIPTVSYRVNGYTPLKWFADRYKFSKDDESGITDYPLAGVSGEETRKIIGRLVHVGVESDRLVAELTEEEFEQLEWKPKKFGLDAHMHVREFQSRLV